MQQELSKARHVNALLTGGSAAATELPSLLKAHDTLEDYGLRVRALDSPGMNALPELAVDSDSGFIDPPRAAVIQRAAAESGLGAHPVFSYLANTIRVGDREVPYSLVTAIDLSLIAGASAGAGNAPGDDDVILNDWTARALQAKM